MFPSVLRKTPILNWRLGVVKHNSDRSTQYRFLFKMYHERNGDRRKEWGSNRKRRDEGASSSRGYNNRGKRRGRGSHPAGLTGREIGLYYRNKARERNEATKAHIIPIQISEGVKSDIQALLASVKMQRTPRSRSKENKYDHIYDSSFKTNFMKTISTSIEEKLESAARVLTTPRNAELDQQLKDELTQKLATDRKYLDMIEFRKKLPSFKCKDKILDLVRENQVIVISGETGCGKTTQVAQFILDDCILNGEGSICKIVCTQPRRISAISVAERVADERNESCGGGSVGYQIRLEKELPREQGSILYCTTGVLLQQMQMNPALQGITHLVLDEIHERDTICDFLITLLKQVLKIRKDLKLILMSATLNSDRFSKYYNDCPCLNIPGFTYPVKEYYLEDLLIFVPYEFPVDISLPTQGWAKHLYRNKLLVQAAQDYTDFIGPYARYLENSRLFPNNVVRNLRNPNSEKLDLAFVFQLIKHIYMNEGDGAILVFLPGFADISKLHTKLTETPPFLNSSCQIFPLHSKLPSVHQRQIFSKPPEGVRKIIISTNIAETSITIDDVVFVIDCGKIKMKNYNVEDNIETLQAEWVSLANAKQRRGRAGRVQPGFCYHTFSRAREMTLQSYPLPEMLRSRLEEVILRIKILQLGNAGPFLQEVMDPPDPRAVENSISLLRTLNALDDEENLTPLGFHLAQLPMDPKSSKMVLMGAMFSCLDPVLSIAASLSFKDAFQLPIGKEKQVEQRKRVLSRGSKSDHIVFAEAMRQWEDASARGRGRQFCYENFLSEYTMKLHRDMKKQIAEHLHAMNFVPSSNPKDIKCNRNSNNISLLKAIICSGLYPNVAKIKTIHKKMVAMTLTTAEDGNCSLFPGSVNAHEGDFQSPFFVYHLKLKSTQIYLHDTTMVHPLPLLFFGDKISQEMEDGREVIRVTDLVKFRCRVAEANIVIDLRKRLNWLLEYKLAHPGFIDWFKQTDEVAILRAIMHLITLEDNDQLTDNY